MILLILTFLIMAFFSGMAIFLIASLIYGLFLFVFNREAYHKMQADAKANNEKNIKMNQLKKEMKMEKKYGKDYMDRLKEMESKE